MGQQQLRSYSHILMLPEATDSSVAGLRSSQMRVSDPLKFRSQIPSNAGPDPSAVILGRSDSGNHGVNTTFWLSSHCGCTRRRHRAHCRHLARGGTALGRPTQAGRGSFELRMPDCAGRCCSELDPGDQSDQPVASSCVRGWGWAGRAC